MISDKVKDLPQDDRPREKILLKGVQNLSDSELISVILRTGTKGISAMQIAREMLTKYGNLNVIADKTSQELTKIRGIGKDKAAAVLAAFELGRRAGSQKKWFSAKKITSPGEIAEIFIPLLRNENKERFILICLNSANRIIKYETISVGNLNSSIVHPREVFKVAIDNNSANIILLHNHPSGNPEPSNEDLEITRKLVEAGKLMGISVFDHIIIAGEFYKSLIEEKII